MITLTLAPAGWTWRYSVGLERWELGHHDDLDRWWCHSYINQEMINYTDPQIFMILLQEFATFACRN